MAKLWPSLSVLLVFVMLLFLAPTLLLLPGQIVSANGEEVVQEVTATFTFNETGPGDWWTFTAGENGINATYGLYFAQYTRADVTRTAAQGNVSNCTFRNYTTGSGSVSGDLSGSLSLAWITFNFNLEYPNSTQLYHDYGTGAHFGWMAGRGHIGENLTFVYIIDFDSDDATMSNAVGKGFMVSVNETGDFAGHKIIGDFIITKAGSSWSGTFNLRNYAPNEVNDLGWLNVTGGVVQEPTDDIHAPTALLDFTTDGPQVTPTNMTTDFEEVGWGKDPAKVITSGHLGIGGDMIVARNSALYLELGALWDPPGVRIMGTTVNNIYIDDNNTGNRTGDGSPYGELWELLVLFIPNQILPLGDNFTQAGYTYTPFGMLHEGTQCYAGTENFALATILISSSLSDALQWSVDHSYGLYPHPKVDNVTPGGGMPNTTMNVNITGKYFLRADNSVPNSGSVSFGDGITVNSYTIKNSSPIDNTITANITIDPSATPGPRVVNVTSCFNYTNGNGTAPYLSGNGVFNVTGETGTLQGQVSFYRAGGSGCSTWVTPLVVKFYDNSSKTLVLTKDVTTDAYGNFTIDGIGVGTYAIGIKNWTTLSRMVYGKVFTPGNTTAVNFGTTLIEADCDNSDKDDGSDYAKVLNNYNARKVADPTYWANNELWKADYNRDAKIDGSDYASVLNNYGGRGDIFYYTH